MKKNLMSLAVAASVVGVTASAQAAMYVNPDKTGSVLLFPYYNAQNGNETSMHIVNTTSEAKAVKVRFMEYVNSQEVLDFNLYLSEKDHFSFTIYKNPNGDGGAIITRDNSCTVPELGDATAGVPGSQTENADGSITRIQPFLNYQYAKDADSSYSRSLAGHVEVIEMGVLTDTGTDTWATYATHLPTGIPANCAKLVAAWSSKNGVNGAWQAAPTDGIAKPTGGLYGLSNILNSADAAAFGVEPAAIEAFWEGSETGHTDPGDTLPDLGEGSKNAIVPNNGASYTLAFPNGEDAVSALFMTKSISNDVMINPDLAGLTDWVVTFPTRRYYVNTTLRSPFTSLYKTTDVDASCEPVGIVQYDREEAQKDTSQTPVFSPKPPSVTVDPNKLCFETNTITTADTSAMSANGTVKLDFSYVEGWQQISFTATGHTLATGSTGTGPTMTGLPAMGFAAFKYTNATSNYGFASDHKTDTAGSAVGS